MNSFFKRYQATFEIVVRLLGNGWRVNLLDDCQYRIKLTTAELKRYVITVREENNRLIIHGFIESRQWRGNGARCTVSPSRGSAGIADDIRRKILIHAHEDIEKALEAERIKQEALEQDKIIKGMLSRLVKLESHYNAFTGYKAENGLQGSVTKRFDGYGVFIQGLSVEQLIKITGAIKQL